MWNEPVDPSVKGNVGLICVLVIYDKTLNKTHFVTFATSTTIHRLEVEGI